MGQLTLIEDDTIPEKQQKDSAQIIDYTLEKKQELEVYTKKEISQQFLQQYKKCILENQLTPQECHEMKIKTESIVKKFEETILKSQSSYKQEIAQLCLFEFYRSKGFNVQLTDEVFQKIPHSECLAFQQQIVSTGQTQNLQYLKVKFEESDNFSYEKVISDSQTQRKFIEIFIEAASKQFKVPKEDISIIDILKGSLIVNCHIANASNENFVDFMICGTDQFEQCLGNPSIELMTFLDYFQIGPNMFNSKFDMSWSKSLSTQIESRGALPFKKGGLKPQRYYFPVGYKGYGLNVQKWLENDTKWIRQDGQKDTWIVLYHGAKENGIKNIINEGLKSGPNNSYENYVCRITETQIKEGANQNVYLADTVDDNKGSGYYAQIIKICEKKYKFVFQCRVNPNFVKSPTKQPAYYTVEQNDANDCIRPYRLLIKEVNDKQTDDLNQKSWPCQIY